MKGMGTDEKAIIDVMGYRSSVQREDICKMFKTMYGKDLRDELAGETSGNFKRALKALCLAACDYDAYEINRAVKVSYSTLMYMYIIMCVAAICIMSVLGKWCRAAFTESSFKKTRSVFFAIYVYVTI